MVRQAGAIKAVGLVNDMLRRIVCCSRLKRYKLSPRYWPWKSQLICQPLTLCFSLSGLQPLLGKVSFRSCNQAPATLRCSFIFFPPLLQLGEQLKWNIILLILHERIQTVECWENYKYSLKINLISGATPSKCNILNIFSKVTPLWTIGSPCTKCTYSRELTFLPFPSSKHSNPNQITLIHRLMNSAFQYLQHSYSKYSIKQAFKKKNQTSTSSLTLLTFLETSQGPPMAFSHSGVLENPLAAQYPTPSHITTLSRIWAVLWAVLPAEQGSDTCINWSGLINFWWSEKITTTFFVFV